VPSRFSPALGVSDFEWIEFLAGERTLNGLESPPLPDEAFQRSWVGSSGISAFHEGGAFCSHALDILRARGVPRANIGRVLDFGCGWGRIYRLLLRNCDEGSLVGVDLDPSCVQHCREAMPYGFFHECRRTPPLGFADGAFDVVTAYSVFSHLSEPAFLSWLKELNRILRLGGMLFFTTLKEAHIAVWESKTSEIAHGAALAAAEFNALGWRERARSGGFLFVPTGGGGPREATFYGEAIVSQPYVERRARNLGFQVLEFDVADYMPQSFVALAKMGPAAA
jgi:SAM-dependent methyltransferase